jgi:RNA polymerase sigma-70 factor (ECF subfamily)
MLQDSRAADQLVRACLLDALGRLTEISGDESALRLRLLSQVHERLATRARRQARRRIVPDTAKTESDPIKALGRLPFEQRGVVYLVSVEELSYASVADVLGIPASRVMALLVEGREGLRQIMGGTAPSRSGKLA